MAVDIFLDIPEIKGESQKQGYEGQIDIVSYSDGVVQQTSFAVLGQGGGSGRAEFQDIHLVKYVDKATANLWKACANHEHFGKATITFLKHGGDGTKIEYLKVELKDIAVSGLQITGSASGDMPMESVTLGFAKATKTYKEQKADGTEGPTSMAEYSIREDA
jgi:type VI secretion system secreted protein Hcp